MAHSIVAVIGQPATVQRIATAAGCPSPTRLPLGLSIVPLGEEQIDRLTKLHPGSYMDGFTYLSAALRFELINTCAAETVVYVETEYFGGMGGQAAAVFSGGEMLLALSESDQEITAESPINSALRMIGVVATPGLDEFATLGLVRFRDNESLGLRESDA